MDWCSIGLLCTGMIARIASISFVSRDITEYLTPWYSSLVRGGFSMLATEFSNYTPPYLYLLWIASLVFGPDHSLLAIKCVSIACDVGLCVVVAMLVRRCTPSAVTRLRAFAISWCIPIVIINSSFWGQCDALYTAVAIAAIVAAYSRPYLACFLLGAAVTIKLQAIFIAPAIGCMLLAGRTPWRALSAAVVSPAVLLAPAAWAGRDWSDLLTIYVRQAGTYHELSMNAPNLWEIINALPGTHGRLFDVLVMLGLLVAMIAGVMYLQRGRQILAARSPTMVVELGFVAAFVFPFVLPKMHDRYFFQAGVLAVGLAIANPAWRRVAVLVQIASLAAYAPFLLNLSWLLALGIAGNVVVFAALVLRWYPHAAQRLPLALQSSLSRILGGEPDAVAGSRRASSQRFGRRGAA
jgi:Gpi18-like mannosyltransferase